eukprot:5819755-Pyramimonas_sp.AAC.1
MGTRRYAQRLGCAGRSGPYQVVPGHGHEEVRPAARVGHERARAPLQRAPPGGVLAPPGGVQPVRQVELRVRDIWREAPALPAGPVVRAGAHRTRQVRNVLRRRAALAREGRAALHIRHAAPPESPQV